MSTVIDVDLSRYFDTIRHSVKADKIAKRVQNTQVLHLVKQIIKVGGKVGAPQGGPFSPLAANIYLNEVDWAFDAIRRKMAQEVSLVPRPRRFVISLVSKARAGAPKFMGRITKPPGRGTRQ
jgi:retron-type reverse transcriptase